MPPPSHEPLSRAEHVSIRGNPSRSREKQFAPRTVYYMMNLGVTCPMALALHHTATYT